MTSSPALAPALGLEQLPQLGDVDLKEVRRRLGRPLLPEVLDEPVARDDLVRVEEEDREQSPLLRASELERATLGADFEGPENQELELPLGRRGPVQRVPPYNRFRWVQRGFSAVSGARLNVSLVNATPVITQGRNREMFDMRPTMLTWSGSEPAPGEELPPPADAVETTAAASSAQSRGTSDRRRHDPIVADLVAENERLRKLVKLQADLVASVSHDLRTPLTSVLGFTDVLLKRDFEPAARERYLRIVNGEMRRFARLIDDLYDAQLIAEGRNVMSLETFDLGHLLLEQVDLFNGQGDLHALDLELPSRPLVVRADRERIARVVANLLSNAIKYSPNGGTITIAAERAGRRRARLGARQRARHPAAINSTGSSRSSSAPTPRAPTSRASGSGSRSAARSCMPTVARSGSRARTGRARRSGSSFGTEQVPRLEPASARRPETRREN